ncbi:MAG: SprT family zinc-dependent metalloprotease [Thiobacillaceae bacterium]
MLPRLNNGFLDLGDTAVPFELRRSSRRRTLGMTVTPRHVRIHAPNWTPRAEIAHYVQQQKTWLRHAWAKMQIHAESTAETVPNELMFLGKRLSIEFYPSLFINLRRAGHTLRVECPLNHNRDTLVRDWLYQKAGKLLAWRLARIARHQRRTPTRFALSDAQTQWGSCTRSGHIRLNWRLVQAPLTLIDYVAAHELAHLVHLDHSPAFWAQVAVLCPDALARRTSLRKMSESLFRV